MRAVLFLLLILVVGGAKGQRDRYFPNVGAEFTLAWPCMDPTNGPYTMWLTSTFTAQPSVIIDGLEWGAFEDGSGSVAVEGDQVWYRGDADTSLLLYDFGLSVGDTAYRDAYYDFGHTRVVTIDTLELVGRERRLFTMDNGDRWLEGIGSLMGPLRPFYETPIGCGDPQLSYCADYMDEGGTPYRICSDLITGSDARPDPTVTVYPNPARGGFVIRAHPGEGRYVLRDLGGALVQQGRLLGVETRIEAAGLSPGAYVLEVADHRMKLMIR